jgi:chromosome segregation ATPase
MKQALLKINDLTKAKSVQLEQLHQSHKDEVRDLDEKLSKSVESLKEYKAKLDKNKATFIDAYQKINLKFRGEIELKKTEILRMKNALTKMKQFIESLNAKITAQTGQLDKLTTIQNSTAENVKNSQKIIQALTAQIEKGRTHNDSILKQNQELKLNNDKIKLGIVKVKDVMTKLQTHMNKYKNQSVKCTEESTIQRKEIDQIRVHLQESNELRRSLEEAVEHFRTKLEECKADNNRLKKSENVDHLLRAKEKIDTLQIEVNKYKATIEDEKVKRTDTDARMNDILDRQKSRHKILDNLNETLQAKLGENKTLHDKNEKLNETIKSQLLHISDVENENKELTNIEKDLFDCKRHSENLEKDLIDFEQTEVELETDYEEAQKKIQTLQNKLQSAYQEHTKELHILSKRLNEAELNNQDVVELKHLIDSSIPGSITENSNTARNTFKDIDALQKLINIGPTADETDQESAKKFQKGIQDYRYLERKTIENNLKRQSMKNDMNSQKYDNRAEIKLDKSTLITKRRKSIFFIALEDVKTIDPKMSELPGMLHKYLEDSSVVIYFHKIGKDGVIQSNPQPALFSTNALQSNTRNKNTRKVKNDTSNHNYRKFDFVLYDKFKCVSNFVRKKEFDMFLGINMSSKLNFDIQKSSKWGKKDIILHNSILKKHSYRNLKREMVKNLFKDRSFRNVNNFDKFTLLLLDV